MLTSANSYKMDQMIAAQEQKQEWLLDRGIRWDLIVTSTGEEKGMYAEPDALLIDDTMHNTQFFDCEGGMTLLYQAEDWERTDFLLKRHAI
jgi:hypothetical protein